MAGNCAPAISCTLVQLARCDWLRLANAVAPASPPNRLEFAEDCLSPSLEECRHLRGCSLLLLGHECTRVR